MLVVRNEKIVILQMVIKKKSQKLLTNNLHKRPPIDSEQSIAIHSISIAGYVTAIVAFVHAELHTWKASILHVHVCDFFVFVFFLARMTISWPRFPCILLIFVYFQLKLKTKTKKLNFCFISNYFLFLFVWMCLARSTTIYTLICAQLWVILMLLNLVSVALKKWSFFWHSVY